MRKRNVDLEWPNTVLAIKFNFKQVGKSHVINAQCMRKGYCSLFVCLSTCICVCVCRQSQWRSQDFGDGGAMRKVRANLSPCPLLGGIHTVVITRMSVRPAY